MSRFPSRQSSRTDLHTMKALTFSAERGLQLENIDDGKFERAKPEGEASIDVIYAGICSTVRFLHSIFYGDLRLSTIVKQTRQFSECLCSKEPWD